MEVKEIQAPQTPELQEEEEEVFLDEDQKHADLYQAFDDGEYDEQQREDVETYSPEESVESDPSKPSSPADHGMYNVVIKKMADRFNVQLEEDKPQARVWAWDVMPKKEEVTTTGTSDKQGVRRAAAVLRRDRGCRENSSDH
ncbi:hypothetical protein NDU88_000472 [Pleurodeles waltl]|uniref:Uncharacterized protein n=1 Tax=Pleurodeles waltl TaxID=8319 RepID=A0AAV7L8G3_PLEWA|nr:hypothetical protein NDU88_000472 [Pleurodeles waltl]